MTTSLTVQVFFIFRKTLSSAIPQIMQFIYLLVTFSCWTAEFIKTGTNAAHRSHILSVNRWNKDMMKKKTDCGGFENTLTLMHFLKNIWISLPFYLNFSNDLGQACVEEESSQSKLLFDIVTVKVETSFILQYKFSNTLIIDICHQFLEIMSPESLVHFRRDESARFPDLFSDLKKGDSYTIPDWTDTRQLLLKFRCEIFDHPAYRLYLVRNDFHFLRKQICRIAIPRKWKSYGCGNNLSLSF